MSTSITEKAVRELRQQIKRDPGLLQYKHSESDEEEPDGTPEISFESINKLSIQKLIYVENIRISTLYADTVQRLAKSECEYDDIELKHTALKAEHNNLCLDHEDMKEKHAQANSSVVAIRAYWAGSTICIMSAMLCYAQFVC